jgi:hypothetical protein
LTRNLTYLDRLTYHSCFLPISLWVSDVADLKTASTQLVQLYVDKKVPQKSLRGPAIGSPQGSPIGVDRAHPSLCKSCSMEYSIYFLCHELLVTNPYMQFCLPVVGSWRLGPDPDHDIWGRIRKFGTGSAFWCLGPDPAPDVWDRIRILTSGTGSGSWRLGPDPDVWDRIRILTSGTGSASWYLGPDPDPDVWDRIQILVSEMTLFKISGVIYKCCQNPSHWLLFSWTNLCTTNNSK